MARAAIKPAASPPLLPLVIGTSRNSTGTPGEASSLSTLATPQPLHDAATNATAEHNNLPTSTQMAEWLQMLGASSQILLHLALARTTVTATGTGRGRLSRVTNPSASGLPIATQIPSTTLVYRARAKLII